MKTQCTNGHTINATYWVDSEDELRILVPSNCPECQAKFFELMDSQKQDFYRSVQRLRDEGRQT